MFFFKTSIHLNFFGYTEIIIELIKVKMFCYIVKTNLHCFN